MRLEWRRFDAIGAPRVTQLINKTNQFNLTTRRMSEAEVRAVMDEPDALGLQFRLIDCFGDNGIIAVMIARKLPDRPDWPGGAMRIDTWLMSCRVLGRGVEAATLAVMADQARRSGVAWLVGEYRPSGRNGLVADLYPSLGFARVTPPDMLNDNSSMQSFILDLSNLLKADYAITTKEA